MNKNIKVKIQSMPLWQNDMSIKTLDGGLTNENFLIENKDKKYVVRLGNDIPEHLVSRSNELNASIAASYLKIGPDIIYHNQNIHKQTSRISPTYRYEML